MVPQRIPKYLFQYSDIANDLADADSYLPKNKGINPWAISLQATGQ